ncbi:MAG: hypothetical protein EWV53_18280 [Microcystis panniformis Mp_MB_F_20051200_S9]|uniref:Acetylglutamate kinase n=1 Tax=Microcystis panniformis Mp_MB_F_20051200_S9 TaxID=2486223 RepID=A0A552PPA4_9CHRO|nr:MAG: hypothetical protein EWV42_21335 [Microcystis panniformis Mp_GB_SS_20050300_S99D]TRV45468.1 MAG: hypothetical protein EWV43_16775 [Microcystis panniformis Mp_MB_F_20080800_S26D]TRV49657.1 MAG: hypothetical protein EWV87_10035 [Microcystis panniformis Mp_GB_SS_20050300_S99]TRV55980.1 MAG: hypothetical protein EWV69_19175 [Microcystis panniformis Mp_MB_F_20080800_S26]TRV58797.1 MAG: hypothetical protein EWV53_18280 [Microcystis panniformis Mp_MB_F_20051200_S9]TRV60572.1 MAG: hypothetical
MDNQPTIRQLVEQALYYRQITPEIENGINELLGRLGYVSDVDYEALELLMDEMDEGRINLVPRR